MSTTNSITKALRLAFGSFMIIIYLGMAYLLWINFFDWDDTATWRTIRKVVAVLLGAYGCYRCYRQVTGSDYYRGLNTRYLDNDDSHTAAENATSNAADTTTVKTTTTDKTPTEHE